MEKLFFTDKVRVFEIAASLPYYENILHQFSGEETNYDQLVKNVEFFKTYINYKLLGVPLSEYPSINIDPNTINYDQIQNLFLTFGLTAASFT